MTSTTIGKRLIPRALRRRWFKLRQRGPFVSRYLIARIRELQSSILLTTSGAIWLILQGFVAEMRRDPSTISDAMSMEISWVVHPRNVFRHEESADEFMGAVEFMHAMDRQFTRNMMRYAKLAHVRYQPMSITRDDVVALVNTHMV